MFRYEVKGHSMEPFLKEGDRVFILPKLFFGKFGKGDVVVFRGKNGKNLIKRISEIFPDGFLLAGDNEKDSLDSRKLGVVKEKDIIGKFWFKY